MLEAALAAEAATGDVAFGRLADRAYRLVHRRQRPQPASRRCGAGRLP